MNRDKSSDERPANSGQVEAVVRPPRAGEDAERQARVIELVQENLERIQRDIKNMRRELKGYEDYEQELIEKLARLKAV